MVVSEGGAGLWRFSIKHCWVFYTDLFVSSFQWKVRRTLAFSIHELAVIVGEDITNNDLVPVFNGFLRDLDEVRIGVLKHFSDFLRVSLSSCGVTLVIIKHLSFQLSRNKGIFNPYK